MSAIEPLPESDELDLWPYPGDNAPVDDRLDWELRKYRTDKTKLDEKIAFKDRQQAQLDSWFETVSEPILDRISRHEENIRNLMRLRLQADPTVKSVTLPNGRVVTRKGAASVEVEDYAAFVEWAMESHPELLRIPPALEPQPDKVKIKGLLLSAIPDPGALDSEFSASLTSPDGEVVPGLRYIRKARTVDIDIPEDGGEE